MQNRAWKLADLRVSTTLPSASPSRRRVLSAATVPMTQIETETEGHAPAKRVISLGRAKVAGLACLPLLLFAFGFARFELGHTALTGLSIAGVDAAGLSAEELESRIRARANALAKQPLHVRIADKQAALTPAELGIEISATASAQSALAVGRNAGFFPNAWRYARSFWAKEHVLGVVRVDRARLERALDGTEAKLIEDPPIMGAIEIDRGVPKAAPPRSGRKIARQAAQHELEQAVAQGGNATIVALPTQTFAPTLAPGTLERNVALARALLNGRVVLVAGARRLEIEPADLGSVLRSQQQGSELGLSIDAARLDAWLASRRAALEAPARDAAFEVTPRDEVKVVASEPGVRLVAEDIALALWQAAQRDGRQGELPLRREPLPSRSTEQAQRLGIARLVGSFTTRHPCCQRRVENIHRIAALLDGLVVEPGQTVSVNAVVGPRTQKNGFVLAPGIEDGEMVDSVGGGVSQFATTFFNALFHAGYDIIERQPHTYWFPRYPMAHEATLSWPKPDIVFKNDSNAGLLVKTSFSKTTITVKLYGDNGGRKVTSSVSERREIVRPAVELLPNREVEPDEEKVKDGGMIGWSVTASRTVTFADGTKKEEKRKVTYKPKARRVEVHPCRIPDGEPGATGERCPEPSDAEETSSEATAQPE
jgi:vancomycin resistance protein YoaR